MTTDNSIALLAPVPIMHLESGFQKCLEKGKVAYGSNAWQVFRELDQLRANKPIDVYIYASWEEVASPAPVASWHAIYREYQEFRSGESHPYQEFRPDSTNGEDRRDEELAAGGFYSLYWIVTNLEKLSRPIPICEFRGHQPAKKYKRNFIPEGPLIVEHPN